MNWFIRNKVSRLLNPFKHGFWCQMCIGKDWRTERLQLGMFWEEWDSFAGDGDYGLVYAWTGNRKTWKELRHYKKFGMDDDGFVFIVPFFVAWLLVLPGTIIEWFKREKELAELDRLYREGKI